MMKTSPYQAVLRVSEYMGQPRRSKEALKSPPGRRFSNDENLTISGSFEGFRIHGSATQIKGGTEKSPGTGVCGKVSKVGCASRSA
jgi:hypothetical protein